MITSSILRGDRRGCGGSSDVDGRRCHKNVSGRVAKEGTPDQRTCLGILELDEVTLFLQTVLRSGREIGRGGGIAVVFGGGDSGPCGRPGLASLRPGPRRSSRVPFRFNDVSFLLMLIAEEDRDDDDDDDLQRHLTASSPLLRGALAFIYTPLFRPSALPPSAALPSVRRQRLFF